MGLLYRLSFCCLARVTNATVWCQHRCPMLSWIWVFSSWFPTYLLHNPFGATSRICIQCSDFNTRLNSLAFFLPLSCWVNESPLPLLLSVLPLKNSNQWTNFSFFLLALHAFFSMSKRSIIWPNLLTYHTKLTDSSGVSYLWQFSAAFYPVYPYLYTTFIKTCI